MLLSLDFSHSNKSDTVSEVLEFCVKTSQISIDIGSGNQHQDACEKKILRFPGVTVVGAMDRENNIPIFSNFGKCVNIYAPGKNILSAKADPGNPSSHCYTEKSGSSMASAHLTGARARYISGLREAPTLHEMAQWVEENSLLTSTEILSHHSLDTVRRLYIGGRYTEIV